MKCPNKINSEKNTCWATKSNLKSDVEQYIACAGVTKALIEQSESYRSINLSIYNHHQGIRRTWSCAITKVTRATQSFVIWTWTG